MAVVFEGLGLVSWPLLLSVVAILGLSIWCGSRLLRRQARPDARTRVWVDAILFFGLFAALSGLIGNWIGITLAAKEMELTAGQPSMTLLWGGIKVAMIRGGLGAIILAFASLLWFALRWRWQLLKAAAEDGPL